jgi:YD repeat-containing protein
VNADRPELVSSHKFDRAPETTRSFPVCEKQTLTRGGAMMKNKLIGTIAVSAALVLAGAAQAKEHEEKELNSSDVPAAVQKAAEKKANGAKIVRWEKEGKNYEAVIQKDGKEWGYTFDASGKSKGKHDEAGEKEEKGEKH